jgi:uncharacterized protein (DUF885 family)
MSYKRWLLGRHYSGETVQLSRRVVKFFEITHRMANDADNVSGIGQYKDANRYLQMMEYLAVDMTNKQIDNLAIKDGNALRTKMQEILMKESLLLEPPKNVEKKKEDFYIPPEDEKWFHNSSKIALARSKGGRKW